MLPQVTSTVWDNCISLRVVVQIIGTGSAMACGFFHSYTGFAALILCSLAAIPALRSFMLPLDDPKRKLGSPNMAITLTASCLLVFDSAGEGLATLVIVLLVSLALTAGNDLLQDLDSRGYFRLQPGPEWLQEHDADASPSWEQGGAPTQSSSTMPPSEATGSFGSLVHLCEYVGVTIVIIGCIPILVNWQTFRGVQRILMQMGHGGQVGDRLR